MIRELREYREYAGHLPQPLVKPREGAAAARLDTLAGKTLGLLDINKPGCDIFLVTSRACWWALRGCSDRSRDETHLRETGAR
jgi:hypothetical protein